MTKHLRLRFTLPNLLRRFVKAQILDDITNDDKDAQISLA